MSQRLAEPRAQTAFLLARHRIDLVLDVGANVGQYALGLRGAGYGGRIVSFEPQAAAHAALRQAAGADPLWQVAPRCAVGAEAGTIALNISAASDMSSALPFTAESAQHFESDRFVATETVPLFRLDALWSELVPAGARVFLKSDTQGFDLAVLTGAGDRLAETAGIQVEASLHPVYQGQPGYRAVLDFLEPRGFALMQVIPG
ncbi:MAG: FkbM family methyltransferase [Alphaproteobacteria bacterium]